MFRMIPYDRRNDWMDLFGELDRSFFAGAQRQRPIFRTDIREETDRYILEADLPGFEKENIDLDVKDGVLTISATQEEVKETGENQEKRDGSYICRERYYGAFRRSFDLSGIQEDAISAGYDKGVLTLILPKRAELVPQARKIAIE